MNEEGWNNAKQREHYILLHNGSNQNNCIVFKNVNFQNSVFDMFMIKAA